MHNQPMSYLAQSEVKFGLSETLSESLSPNEKRLHILAEFGFSPNLGLSESFSGRLIQKVKGALYTRWGACE